MRTRPQPSVRRQNRKAQFDCPPTQVHQYALALRIDTESRKSLASDNRRGLVYELVILECLHHEKGKVYTTCHMALENGIAYVPNPDR